MGPCAVSRELLPAVTGLLPVPAPLITTRRWPRQAPPVVSLAQRRVSPALLGQDKYSVVPCPSAGQGGGEELPR